MDVNAIFAQVRRPWGDMDPTFRLQHLRRLRFPYNKQLDMSFAVMSLHVDYPRSSRQELAR